MTPAPFQPACSICLMLHARASTLGLTVMAALTACASAPQPRSTPAAWAQTAEEAGQLPVGTVVRVEAVSFTPEPTRSSEFAGMAAVTGLVPAMLATAILDTARSDQFFRHTIRLEGTSETIVRDEFAAYKIGDCVALRVKPDMLVPAFAGQCKTPVPSNSVAEPVAIQTSQ